jgi:7,8-dihydroneopterin aldolase/epimerase/oxygenase
MAETIPFTRANAATNQPSSTVGVYQILIRDLTLMASVGVHAHERDAPQPIQFNLNLKVRRGGSGLGVVDYQAIVTGIAALMARKHIDLVEEVGEQIIDFCMSDPRVEEITIRVEKLNAIKQTASVGIEMTRKSAR